MDTNGSAADTIQNLADPIADVLRIAEERSKGNFGDGVADPRRAREAFNSLKSSLGERYAPGRVSLEKYEVYHPGQESAIGKIQALVTSWPDSIFRGDGLVFFGSVGTGKDHLMISLLYLAASKFSIPCKWIRGLDFYGDLRDRMESKQKEEEILRKMAEPQILGISDPVPPIGELTPWRTELLQRLVDRRYHALKPTWVTMNAGRIEEADDKLSAPVFDRLRESAEIIRCFWPSYRERKR